MTTPSSAPRPPGTGLEGLVRGHQATVWRYLRFLGCDPEEADDLTQETFVSVLDKPLDRFGDAGARAYLRRVAKNAFLKRRFAEQLDRPAIAARLDIGAHGVKSLLQRSYARLRTCIERRLRHECA